jgi:hypothetical protein
VERGSLFEQAAERFNSDLRECRERVRELRKAKRGARSGAFVYA